MTTRFSYRTLCHIRRVAVFGVLAAVAWGAVTSGSSLAQMKNHGFQAHNHGADGTGHDEVVMPGLRGLDATAQESAELAAMFRNFQGLTREVTNLPNGIRTVTNAQDKELLDILVSHVVGMIDRVDEGRDPKVFIQSPTLDILFERRESIATEIDTTDQGIVVVQTSEDPEVVSALQTHAAEVSAMVDRGMQAVHEMMMKSASN